MEVEKQPKSTEDIVRWETVLRNKNTGRGSFPRPAFCSVTEDGSAILPGELYGSDGIARQRNLNNAAKQP